VNISQLELRSEKFDDDDDDDDDNQQQHYSPWWALASSP
jgi:hypothetical protein